MANESLKLSRAGQNLIKHFESCLRPIGGGMYEAYYDPVGVLTIGWGHTNHHGRQFGPGTVWSKVECDQEFVKDMELFEGDVKRLVKVPLKQYQFDALVSFSYNVGSGALSKSTLLRKVNAGDFKGAALEFQKWINGNGQPLPGLIRRRASEALLFQNIPDVNYDGRPDKAVQAPVDPIPNNEFEPSPQGVDPVPDGEKSPSESKTFWTKIMEFIGIGGLTGVGGILGGIDWRVAIVLLIIVAIGTFMVVRYRLQRDDIDKSSIIAKSFGA